jgi:cell division protein FtsQ
MTLRIILILIFFAAALWGINYLYNSGYFNIEEINITGNTHYDSEYIEDLLEDLKGKNIFEADKKKTEDILIANLVWVKTVEFKKIFPDRIEIMISERKPSLIIVYQGKYFLLDGEGIVLEDLGGQIPDDHSSLLKVSGAIDHGLDQGDTVAKKNVLSCADIYRGFDDGLKQIVKEAGIKDNIHGDIFFKTHEGSEIIFGDSSQVIKKIEVLKLLLKEDTDYNIIDLRSPDNPVVKY